MRGDSEGRNQMKTLKPQEVFEYLINDYVYIAMDKNKEWAAFKETPLLLGELWVNWSASFIPLNIDYQGDWKDSLFVRPELHLCSEQKKLLSFDNFDTCDLCGSLVLKERIDKMFYLCKEYNLCCCCSQNSKRFLKDKNK